MRKPPVTLTLSWTEAMNLLTVAVKADTTGWTKASKGALDRAITTLTGALPMSPADLDAVFLVVRGQEVVKRVLAVKLGECLGHPSGDGADGRMGETVYCDGSCRPVLCDGDGRRAR